MRPATSRPTAHRPIGRWSGCWRRAEGAALADRGAGRHQRQPGAGAAADPPEHRGRPSAARADGRPDPARDLLPGGDGGRRGDARPGRLPDRRRGAGDAPRSAGPTVLALPVVADPLVRPDAARRGDCALHLGHRGDPDAVHVRRRQRRDRPVAGRDDLDGAGRAQPAAGRHRRADGAAAADA